MKRQPHLNGHAKLLTMRVEGDTTIVSTVIHGITFSVHLVPYTSATLCYLRWLERGGRRKR